MSLRLDYNAATPADVTASVPLLIAAIALGGSPAISQSRDQSELLSSTHSRRRP